MKPTLSEKTILAWVGKSAYQRGLRYVREGRVQHPRRMGNVLKALCRGQAIEPYRVEVRLGEDEIVAARCTCPAGSAGRCKHIAAALILWHTQPEAFAAAPPLAAFLQRQSPQTLIRLILKMVERYPDLAEFVFLETGGAAADSRKNDAAPSSPHSPAATHSARGETSSLNQPPTGPTTPEDTFHNMP